MEVLDFKEKRAAGIVLAFALRYALPRMTFAPDIVMDVLEANLDNLTRYDLAMFVEELEEFLQTESKFITEDMCLSQKFERIEECIEVLKCELQERGNEEKDILS